MVFKFTIDDVINKYLPRKRLDRLPKYVRRFLGEHEVKPTADYWIWLDILVSTFCGLALLEGVFKSHTVFLHHNAPMIIASYGASAILCFNAPASPLAQPRNVFVGHFVASLIGVCIQKLFLLSHYGRSNYWAAGALSVAVSSVAMSILNCVHPPAGASALLPATEESIRDMSWWYLPMQLISSVLMLAVTLITGNILRKYPAYWWTQAPLGKKEENKEKSEKEKENEIKDKRSISIENDNIMVPPDLTLSDIEVEWLGILQDKIKDTPTGVQKMV